MMKIQLASEKAGTSRLEDEIAALRAMKDNLDNQAKQKEMAEQAVLDEAQKERERGEEEQHSAASVLQGKMRQRMAKKEVASKKQAIEDAREVVVRVRVTGGGNSGKTGTYICKGLKVFLGFDAAGKYEVILSDTGRPIFKKGSQLEQRTDDDVDAAPVVERKKSVFLMEEEAEEARLKAIEQAKAKAAEEAAAEAERKRIEFENSDEQKAIREIKERNDLRNKVAQQAGADDVAGANKATDWEKWRNGGKLKGRSDK